MRCCYSFWFYLRFTNFVVLLLWCFMAIVPQEPRCISEFFEKWSAAEDNISIHQPSLSSFQRWPWWLWLCSKCRCKERSLDQSKDTPTNSQDSTNSSANRLSHKRWNAQPAVLHVFVSHSFHYQGIPEWHSDSNCDVLLLPSDGLMLPRAANAIPSLATAAASLLWRTCAGWFVLSVFGTSKVFEDTFISCSTSCS